MEKEILGIIVFFMCAGGLLSLAVTNIGITPAGTVTISPTSNPIIEYSGNATETNSTAKCPTVQMNTQNILQNILSIPGAIYDSVLKFFNGCPTYGNPSPGNLNIFNAVGSLTTSSAGVKSSVSPVLDTTIGIAITFIAIGLLAGLLGAGMLAGVISGMGITLSLVYYFLGIINAPNPYSSTGAPYFQIPLPLEGVFFGFVAAIMIYMILSVISSK